jgi:alpha-tubulin suppressor-like RCC1 family protein
MAPDPAPVPGVVDAVSVGAGDTHTCALLADGTVLCWGTNRSRQLGRGIDVREPGGIAPVVEVDDGVALSAGAAHNCVLRGAAREPWCWGANGWGQVGDGTIDDQSAPVPVVMAGGP